MDLLFLIAPLMMGQAPVLPVRLPPVDECASDAGFAEFRARLVEAVERKDSQFVREALAEDVFVDFGGGAGPEYFARAWGLDRPRESRLWNELAEVLRLGCRNDGEGGHWSPSLFQAPGIEDPFGTFLVTRPGATLHAEADASSEVIARLDWNLLEGVDWQEGDEWWRVRLRDGREGYVRRAFLRSPIDYRIAFRNIDGRWRITAFVAGD